MEEEFGHGYVHEIKLFYAEIEFFWCEIFV